MTPEPDLDVLVLGGGPAGCAAATLLARTAHSVGLIRPAEPPAGELAESVPPSARRVLEELGALDAVRSAGFHPNRGNSIWWANQPSRREDFAAGAHGFHVDRRSLERVLIRVAEQSGVRVYAETSARSAERSEAGAWAVACEGPAGVLHLRTPWIVDATGRRGILARTHRVHDRATTTLALVRRWRSRDGWGHEIAGHTLVESYAHGWAWSVPLADDLRCVTVMIDQREAELDGASVDAMLDAELDRTRHLGPLRDGCEPAGAAWACPASLYTASRFAHPGLVLAGDAGSFIDPLSSFGVKKALSSGWLAGVAIHTALSDPSMADTALDFFDAREREVYRRYRAVSADFFSEGAAAHGTEFWRARAAAAERFRGAEAEPAARAATTPRFAATRPADTGSAGTRSATARSVTARSAEAPSVRAQPAEARSRATRSGAAPFDADVPSLLDVGVPEASVRAAFEEIKSRPALDAVRGHSVVRQERPTIEGHRIVLREHLTSSATADGLRFVRGVDLLHLIEIAPRHDQVPDGWAAYNNVAAPVTLPDYLTALATAFAARILEFGPADGAR